MARVTRVNPVSESHVAVDDQFHAPYVDTGPLAPVIDDAGMRHAPAQPTERKQSAAWRARFGEDPWRVFGGMMICLAFALLLNTKAFVTVAEGEPDGAGRTVLLASAHGLDAVASAARLDRVNVWADRALHRKDEAPRFDTAPATTTGGGAPVAAPTAAPTAQDPTPQDGSASASGVPAAPVPTPDAPAGPKQFGGPSHAVTTANPLRVYVAGDSFVDWVGYDMDDYAKKDGLMTTRTDAKISSGLTSPVYFDWPKRLTQAMAAESPPEAVVWFSGANDYNDMRGDDGYLTRGTPEWMAEYRKRVDAMMDIVGRRGGQLYWVGQPVMRDRSRSKLAADITTVVATEAASRLWVHYIDIWSLFTDTNGNYAAYLPDASGEIIRVRQEEGIHLTRTATAWVSERVYKAIQRDWKFTPG